ncbi:disease resistance protein ADR2-like [Raphanus sativus]|uniref:Disease resistance protein ADR2-like n=1 Tax=Raphanus sativus TaxID=3726 RepID=A0A9W3DCC9_RAPSA|nr:disease resistance protein ADR2-like [Raphanus sativus]
MTCCEKLRVIPTNINLASLKRVNMSGCSRLRTFPDFSSNMELLDVHNTMIEDVPSTIAEGWLRSCELNIGSTRLKRLTHVPEYVRRLDLSNSDIKKIPDCVIGLSELQILSIKNCRKLVLVQGLPPSLLFLHADDCVSLKSVCFSYCKPNVALDDWKCAKSEDELMRKFTFYNCYSLEEEARRVIIQGWENMSVGLPGKEVPSEFTHKAKGNSITISICDWTFSASSRFKACLLFSPPAKWFPHTINIVCRLRSKGVLINEILFYPNKRPWYNSTKIPSQLLTDHLFIFDENLFGFGGGRGLEVDSDIQFEFICKYQNSKIIECGVQILGEEGESSSSSSEWKEQSDGAVEASKDENLVKTSKHTGWRRGLKKLVLMKKKNKNKTE